jgi:hypothetical protein
VRRHGGELLRAFQRPNLRLAVGNQLIRETFIHSLRPLEHPRIKQDLPGLGGADPARQRIQNAIIGGQPDPEERKADGATLGQHDAVAQQGQPGAGAHRIALDRSDHRLFGIGQQPRQAMVFLHPRTPRIDIETGHRVDIAAGTEMALSAAENKRRHRVIGEGGRNRLNQRTARLGIKGIALVRTVDRDPGDAGGSGFINNDGHG